MRTYFNSCLLFLFLFSFVNLAIKATPLCQHDKKSESGQGGTKHSLLGVEVCVVSNSNPISTQQRQLRLNSKHAKKLYRSHSFEYRSISKQPDPVTAKPQDIPHPKAHKLEPPRVGAKMISHATPAQSASQPTPKRESITKRLETEPTVTQEETEMVTHTTNITTKITSVTVISSTSSITTTITVNPRETDTTTITTSTTKVTSFTETKTKTEIQTQSHTQKTTQTTTETTTEIESSVFTEFQTKTITQTDTVFTLETMISVPTVNSVSKQDDSDPNVVTEITTSTSTLVAIELKTLTSTLVFKTTSISTVVSITTITPAPLPPTGDLILVCTEFTS